MKIKSILTTAFFLAAGQAYGHGFDLEGGQGSVAQLVTTALAQAAISQPSIIVEALECDGSCFQVRSEDEFGYVECTKLTQEDVTSYQCFTAEKHGKPLRAKEDYRRGKYMNFKGHRVSNATHLFVLLNTVAELNADGLVTVRDINENRRVIDRAADARGETFTCTQDTSSGELKTECRIQR